MSGKKVVAILLAAGSGSRMKMNIKKQYLPLDGKPLLYYSLKILEESPVEEIILITNKEEVSYCQEQIVNQYGFKKVKQIKAGGKERYHSVYEGLKAIDSSDYVLIHDGARPFITEAMVEEAIAQVQIHQACVIAVPVKDTIKIADQDQFAISTPDRNLLWQIQTPQIFSYSLLKHAYEELLTHPESLHFITDDAMMIERVTGRKIKLLLGDYSNIKITTPDDFIIAKSFVKK